MKIGKISHAIFFFVDAKHMISKSVFLVQTNQTNQGLLLLDNNHHLYRVTNTGSYKELQQIIKTADGTQNYLTQPLAESKAFCCCVEKWLP